MERQKQQPVRGEQEVADRDRGVAAQQAEGAEAASVAAAAAPKDPEVVSFRQDDDVPFDDTTLRGEWGGETTPVCGRATRTRIAYSSSIMHANVYQGAGERGAVGGVLLMLV